MEFRQLRYFVKVAELRSFSEASKTLFISQSTLSQQIKQLEEELGVELLVRDSRHVSMSDYGEQYLPYAKQVLKDVDTSTERMNDVRQLKIGTLNVGATYTFCPLLADTVRDYMKKYPGIKLKIYCRSMENLMEMLEHGQLDVALSYKPLQSYDDIDSHILFNSNLCVIAGKDNPVAKKKEYVWRNWKTFRSYCRQKGCRQEMPSTIFFTARTLNSMSVWRSTTSACFSIWSPEPTS